MPLPSVETIRKRLEIIFPEGISDRLYLVRDVAAKTVFTMLYIDAIQGRGPMLAPVHVYRMGDAQAALQEPTERTAYREAIKSRSYVELDGLWMRDNSRESVRDESLRDGLRAKGAVIEDRTVPTTSSKGRYALQAEFAALFTLSDDKFPAAAATWRESHLNQAELARVHILHARPAGDTVVVNFPSGESRNIPPGTSSILVKAVVEEFAPRFLGKPAVLWLSDSRDKVVIQDDRLMREIGLPIDQQRLLPDVVLADLSGRQMRLFFIEIVATDGPITEARRLEILQLAATAGFPADMISFVSAFEHRNASPLKKRLSALALESYVWCMAEPDALIWISRGNVTPVSHTGWKSDA